MVALRVGRALPDGPESATAKMPIAWGRLVPNHMWGGGGCIHRTVVIATTDT